MCDSAHHRAHFRTRVEPRRASRRRARRQPGRRGIRGHQQPPRRGRPRDCAAPRHRHRGRSTRAHSRTARPAMSRSPPRWMRASRTSSCWRDSCASSVPPSCAATKAGCSTSTRRCCPPIPGLDTHRRALADGARVHGCTVHFVTPEVDHGPIVAQRSLEVRRWRRSRIARRARARARASAPARRGPRVVRRPARHRRAAGSR